ncbi:MAG: hypothetical protein ACK4M0_14445 [Phreatobacter sp.]
MTAPVPPATAGRPAPEPGGQALALPAGAAAPLRLSAEGDAPAASHRGQPCPGLADCPERPRLVRRLYDAAEREIAAVEACLGGRSAAAARRLGALASTLDRLAALDRKALAGRTAAARAPAAGAPDAGAPDAASPPPEAVTAPVDADAWAEGLAAQLDAHRARGARRPA